MKNYENLMICKQCEECPDGEDTCPNCEDGGINKPGSGTGG